MRGKLTCLITVSALYDVEPRITRIADMVTRLIVHDLRREHFNRLQHAPASDLGQRRQRGQRNNGDRGKVCI